MTPDFQPPPLIRGPHTQTLLASLGRRGSVTQRARTLLAAGREVRVTTADDAVLQAWLHARPAAPLVVIIHGWLGSADGAYVLSAATRLWEAGYAVARLNLRDHGDTETLNLGLFHSARTAEVVDAVQQLGRLHGDGRVGVLGFSLGGNFALRVARALAVPTLAVCPAVDPAATMHAIDHGWTPYRWHFIRRWHGALRAKERAFPEHYDFSAAYRLRSVSALTDLFVRYYTEFRDTADYLDRYTLTGTALAGTDATIIAAQDDPIIPSRGFTGLPRSVHVVHVPWGGHCGFLEDRQESWIDRAALRHFRQTLPLPAASTAVGPATPAP